MFSKKIEKVFYQTGTNISYYSVNKEISILKKSVPANFLNRDVIDLGCGDGNLSVKLVEVLLPKSFLCVDLYPELISRAKSKGLNVKVVDLERDDIKGDLGVLWGVVHHFEKPIETLKKLSKNFNNLIIRESVNKYRIFEIGHRYSKSELMNIFDKANVNISKKVRIPSSKSIIYYI